MKTPKILLAAGMLAILAGCGPVISDEVLKTVNRDIQFREVAADPAQYKGKSVVFGGTILNVENRENITEMEVVQEGMNSQLKPVDRGESAGRFIARFNQFMDPAIFSAGKRITVAGTITDIETRPLGKGTYRYPVIESKEHYLWEPSDYDSGSPRIGIGIGLGYWHID